LYYYYYEKDVKIMTTILRFEPPHPFASSSHHPFASSSHHHRTSCRQSVACIIITSKHDPTTNSIKVWLRNHDERNECCVCNNNNSAAKQRSLVGGVVLNEFCGMPYWKERIYAYNIMDMYALDWKRGSSRNERRQQTSIDWLHDERYRFGCDDSIIGRPKMMDVSGKTG
jgi:hypothetical protein